MRKIIFRPAIDMTLNILEAAITSPKVKRVVITSSISALLPSDTLINGTLTKEIIERMYANSCSRCDSDKKRS